MHANLIPRHRLLARHAKQQRRRWLIACAAYAGVLAVCGAFVPVMFRESPHSEAEIVMLKEDLAAGQARLGDLSSKVQAVQLRRSATHHVRQGPDWSILLAVVAEARGEDIVLDGLSLLPAKGTRSPGKILHLKGFAQSQLGVSALALRLEQLRLFDSVAVLGSRREPFMNQDAVAFDLECKLLGIASETP